MLAILGFHSLCHGKGAETVYGVVTKVIDGDSIMLRSGRGTYEIRLWGIDCPEYTQPYSNHSKSISKSLMEKKKARVEVKYRDRYERWVGVVFLDGASMNEVLIRRGAAWVYRRYCREPVCGWWEELENQARMQRRGLWRQKDPQPPWQWRKHHG